MTARALETVSVIADPDYFESPALMGACATEKPEWRNLLVRTRSGMVEEA